MEKTLDRQGRWRSKTVAFRVSPEENNQLEMKVRLSGMTKQDYIVSRLTDREIRVDGNPRVYKALKKSNGRHLCRVAAPYISTGSRARYAGNIADDCNHTERYERGRRMTETKKTTTPNASVGADAVQPLLKIALIV